MTVYQFFKDHFNLPFNKYIDVQMSFVLGKPVLDIFKFDEWLHEKYGNYEDSGDSMRTIILKQYGQDVMDKIEMLATIGWQC